MVTALDELRALDERRRAELRAAEEAEAHRRGAVEASVRERLEAEEESRRQARSRAEAQAWADAMREVEAERARHAHEDQARIAEIEAAAHAAARARLAAELVAFEQAALTRKPSRRGWLVATGLLVAVVLALGWWGRQQAAALALAQDQRAIADRTAAAAQRRADQLGTDLQNTLGQILELRRKVDELRERRPAAPATPPPAAVTRPRPGTTRPGVTTGDGAAWRELKVCTDSPLC